MVSANSLEWPKLIAHWKLDGDCLDATGSHHGEAHGITFTEGRDGRPKGAALLDGLDHFIEIPNHEALSFGTREFSVALWVSLSKDLTSVTGDVLCKYDAQRRKGLNLSVIGSSPGYCSLGDARALHFGIDNGINGSWEDCGKPWQTNPLISTLTVYKGQLYTGLADASKPVDACHVFRYAGGTEWVDCGRVGNHPLTLSVMSMIVHKGHLYAGTGTYDWEKSNVGISGLNHVYRYEGGTEWRDCGPFGNGYTTMSLASFKGSLYAADDNVKCYRYDGGTKWSFCGQPDRTSRLNCLMVYRGHLYGATHGFIYRYDGGTAWECIGKNPFGTTQIHTLQVYDGHLYAGTWPFGKVLRYEGEDKWVDCGQLGIPTDTFQINEVNDLTVYNGKLYAGVIPKAEVYRYEGGTDWTLLRSLVSSPRWSPSSLYSWHRLHCMTVFQGRLFQGTSTCYGRYEPTNPPEAGRVHAMEAGKNVSYDNDLGAGWTHVVAARERGLLKLYINGELRSTSAAFDNSDYDLSNRAPLLIGHGAQNYFSGVLDDVRIFEGALTADQVSDLYRKAGRTG